MSSKNRNFMSDLASSVEQATEPVDRSTRRGGGVLGGRSNRLAEIASGAAVDNPQEFVDPARCRIWERHNRDYTALNYDRCRDLIDSILAQGKQEVPAIVRRVSDDRHYDYEVICGARRHWSVLWLRRNNHPEIRYLIEVRTLTDEQAFRISDLENRAREDLTDLERARDYLKALGLYYNGRQKDMAKRINQSEAWLSRYLDLARLPPELVEAFPDPYELKISHIGALKPILKADDMRAAVLVEARRISEQRDGGVVGGPTNAPEMIRRLVIAAERVARSGTPAKAQTAPKRSGIGSGTICDDAGAPLLRVDGKDRRALTLTLFHKGGGDRAAAEAALRDLLDRYWPKPS
ncbi:replication protein B [Acuticoccus sediminis]|uniref:Replication protein B n=1 Tax=Acuticoccus sediminis TaxID=2184697 RepID=A0A8B2NJL5_9HYPH|nr:ParB/RepB/Spo0J family partition protein [Acuticoccus sediminis]RAH96117.1 replication protein B [Acuticoccus sediminis]